MNDHGRNHVDTAHDERVSALLSAAAAPSEPGPLPGEGAALAVYRASLTPTRRRSMISSLLSARTGLVAAVGAGVLLTGGVTTAAAGGLPGAAQDTASEMLAKVGIQVPGAAVASNGNADTRGNSDTALADEPTDSADDDVAATDDGDDAAATVEVEVEDADGASTGSGKGELISGIATETDAEGAEKGALISKVASDGKSQAGDHGQAGDDHGRSGDAPARPEDAGSASDSASESSQAKADDADQSEESDEDSEDENDEHQDASDNRADGARG